MHVLSSAKITRSQKSSNNMAGEEHGRVSFAVGANTQYILSTSGRTSSMQRYRVLLQELLGLDVVYLPISDPSSQGKIKAENFAMALRGMNAIGGAISRDIKGTIAAQLDEVDDLAREIGAVNTVVRHGGRLHGYNTDAAGFEEAIREGTQGRAIRRALVYGYGGVTAVVVRVLQRMGVTVAITGRRQDAAARRAAELGAEAFEAARAGPLAAASGAATVAVAECGGGGFDLFVNAAPVTDAPLAEASGFLHALRAAGPAAVVFDHEMPGAELRAYCATHGLHHIPGSRMYYPQMVAQWRLFLAGRVPAETDIFRLLQQAEGGTPLHGVDTSGKC